MCGKIHKRKTFSAMHAAMYVTGTYKCRPEFETVNKLQRQGGAFLCLLSVLSAKAVGATSSESFQR